jgi:tetratricopeptide (TPR) repeat protein
MLLLAAEPHEKAEALIRDAILAVDREQFPLADQLLSQAESRTSDPGLVAFNRGILLAQQKRFRDAEVQFRRSLEDSEIPLERRVRGWFNLGNTLVQQAGEENLAQLRSAIGCYENALDRLDSRHPLYSDLVHNLELAKMLWAKANARQPQPKEPNEEPPERPEPKQKQESLQQDEGKNEDMKSKQQEGKEKSDFVEKKGDAKAKETTEKKKTPGAGRLPVLKDDSQVQPISQDDTRRMLQRIADRLERERLNLRKEAAIGIRDRDW